MGGGAHDSQHLSRTYAPAPAGTHVARCVDVHDLGIVRETFGGGSARPVRKVRLVWEVAAVIPQTGRRFVVSRRFNLSLHPTSALRSFLEAWRGTLYTAAELARFDLEQLVGAGCSLTIVHSGGRDGASYARVVSVAELPRELSPLDPAGSAYTRVAHRASTGGGMWARP